MHAFQARIRNLSPVRNSLRDAISIADIIKQQAVNNWSPRYSCVLLRMAPPIGVPISNAMDVTAKTMPSRVPRSRMSFVKLTITTGGRDTNPPEQKPYRIAKTMIPGVLWTPTHAKARMAVAVTAGVSMFNGPVWSATKFGPTRPNVDPAFSIASR